MQQPQLAPQGLHTGVPTPCSRCGAAMASLPGQSLHQAPRMVCRFCRHEEALPPDAAERDRHLRLRLLQLKRARETSEAPLRVFEQVRQAWIPALGLFGLITIFQGVSFLQALEPGLQTEPSVVLTGTLPLGLFCGMLAGWLAMSRAFRTHLQPLLRAKPPLAPGLAARCRCCGAELPPVRAPQVVCRFCSAPNQLDAGLAANASALLQAEAAEHHRRASGWTQDPKVYTAPSRAFYTAGGIVTAAVTITITAIVLAVT